jgi:putative NADH-flavin reductase
MSSIIVFGAGGRAGRQIVSEAARRGHAVTAVVRDPTKHEDLAHENITLVQGDVTQATDVAKLSPGHDAAVTAAARMDVDATEFYTAATRALVDGLGQAGVTRLIAIGIGTTLLTGAGTPLHDSDGFPAEGRAFSLGHAAELEILERDGAALDWLVLAPPPVVLDETAERTGVYKIAGRELIADAAPTFSYADLAVAVIEEIDTPKHHRVLAAVAS